MGYTLKEKRLYQDDKQVIVQVGRSFFTLTFLAKLNQKSDDAMCKDLRNWLDNPQYEMKLLRERDDY